MRRKRVLKQSISAAETALSKLENGMPISIDTLRTLSRALGEPMDLYENMKDGLFPHSDEQVQEAIRYLHDFINDRQIELTKRKKKAK